MFIFNFCHSIRLARIAKMGSIYYCHRFSPIILCAIVAIKVYLMFNCFAEKNSIKSLNFGVVCSQVLGFLSFTKFMFVSRFILIASHDELK